MTEDTSSNRRFRNRYGMIDPGGYGVNTRERCVDWVQDQVQGRLATIDPLFVTVSFPQQYCDLALETVQTTLEKETTDRWRLVSVSHRCCEVYDWATCATFERVSS